MKDQYKFDSSKYKVVPMLVTRNRETGTLERTVRGEFFLKGTKRKIVELIEEGIRFDGCVRVEDGTVINAETVADRIIELILRDLR